MNHAVLNSIQTCLSFRCCRSHVFSNISRILSRCEEEIPVDVEAQENNGIHSSSRVTVLVEAAADSFDVKVSSRTAMVSSLTDGSTETFWESGDEDRGKVKHIALQLSPESAGIVPRVVCVYVDNGRDTGVILPFRFRFIPQ